MKQYHIVYIKGKNRWIVRTNEDDLWIRSSYYKSLAIRKGVKLCKNNDYPSQLVIHLKNGHIEETRDYHKKGM